MIYAPRHPDQVLFFNLPGFRIKPDDPPLMRKGIYEIHLILRQKSCQLVPHMSEIGVLDLHDLLTGVYIGNIVAYRDLMVILVWQVILLHDRMNGLFRKCSEPVRIMIACQHLDAGLFKSSFVDLVRYHHKSSLPS